MAALAPMRAGRGSDAVYVTLGRAGGSMADMGFAYTRSQPPGFATVSALDSNTYVTIVLISRALSSHNARMPMLLLYSVTVNIGSNR
jgi:hypothetical protein